MCSSCCEHNKDKIIKLAMKVIDVETDLDHDQLLHVELAAKNDERVVKIMSEIIGLSYRLEEKYADLFDATRLIKSKKEI